MSLGPNFAPDPWRVLHELCWLNKWLSNNGHLEAVYKQLWLSKVVQVVEFCGRWAVLKTLWDPYYAKPWTTSREAWIFMFWTLGREPNMIQLSVGSEPGGELRAEHLFLSLFIQSEGQSYSKVERILQQTSVFPSLKIYQLLTIYYICWHCVIDCPHSIFVWFFLVVRFGLMFFGGGPHRWWVLSVAWHQEAWWC